MATSFLVKMNMVTAHAVGRSIIEEDQYNIMKERERELRQSKQKKRISEQRIKTKKKKKHAYNPNVISQLALAPPKNFPLQPN